MQSPYHRLEEILDTARDILEEIPTATPSNTPRTQVRLLNISDVLSALPQDARHKRITIPEYSTLDGRLFDKLEAVAKLRRNNQKPFVGIQVTTFGEIS